MKPLIFTIAIIFAIWFLGFLYAFQAELAEQVNAKTGCEYVYHIHRPAELICN